jgi:uncharacterized membrane protein
MAGIFNCYLTGGISHLFLIFSQISRLSKSRRLLLGLLSVLPLVLTVVYIIIFFSFFIRLFNHAQDQFAFPEMMLEHIGLMIGVVLLLLFVKLGLLIYFIVHVVNNTFIDGTERMVWILVFIFAGIIGFPVYWYMRIWKDPEGNA